MSFSARICASFFSFLIILSLFASEALAETSGGISGTVTAADSGEALSDRSVYLYRFDGGFVSWANTDPNGNFQFNDLAAGPYYLRVWGEDYIDEVYSGVECVDQCDVTAGTAVMVTAGEVSTGIDFVLRRGGVISGTVTMADTGNALSDRFVTVYDAHGNQVWSFANTDIDGEFQLVGLPSGSYYVQVHGRDYIDQVYSGVECAKYWCDVTEGKAVAVIAGESVAGIDFTLDRGGSISGVVKALDTGLPLGGHSIKIYAEGEESVVAHEFSAQDDGSYAVMGLPAGDYFVVAEGAGDYIGQYFGGPLCVGWCSRPSGTLVTIVKGQDSAGIDLLLTKGGMIRGVVSSAEGGAPVVNARVSVGDVAGGSVWTNSQGEYQIGGLVTGDYYVQVSTNGHGGMAYGDVPCPSVDCDLSQASTVEVVQGQIVDGINITMAPTGSIAGTLRDQATGLGLGYQLVEAYSWDGRPAGDAWTNERGAYHIDGLLPGAYFVAGPVNSDYIRTIHGGPECLGPWRCMLVLATAVEVLPDQDTTGIDLVSRKGGEISGVVTDADSGTPLSNVYIEAYGGAYSGNAYTDGQGGYRISGLPPGTYTILAHDGRTHSRQAYGDYPCDGCNIELLDDTGISVTTGQSISGIDFALNAKQVPDTGISGRVIAGDTGRPLKGIHIGIRDPDGMGVASAVTDGEGRYRAALPPGDYYVEVHPKEYVAEHYDGAPCLNHFCDTVDGTLVTVAAGQLVTNIDFSLTKGGMISGTVTAIDGKYLGKSVYVKVVDLDGWYVASSSIDAMGSYRIVGLPAGNYFVSAIYFSSAPVPPLYTGKVYKGEDCVPGCFNVVKGTPVRVAEGASVAGIDFTLHRAGAISGTVRAADTGATVAHARVEVYDGDSELLLSGVANAQGEYRLGGLPTGRYYVKVVPVVKRQNGHVYSAPLPEAVDYMATLFGDLPCVNLCDVTRGVAVSVTMGETTSNVDVALSRGDGIAGKVITGETGVGVPYVLLSVFDSAGTWVGFQAWTDANGDYRVRGLSPGRYYLLALGADKEDNQLFDRLPCSSEECVITDGTAVEVVRGRDTTGIDFVLGGVVEEQPIDAVPADSGGGLIGWQLLVLMLCWMLYARAACLRRDRAW